MVNTEEILIIAYFSANNELLFIVRITIWNTKIYNIFQYSSCELLKYFMTSW